MTWLVHDVSVWRTDQLVLDIEGLTVDLHTAISRRWRRAIDDGEGLTGEKWRSLKDGGAIVDLLGAIGVVGDEEPASAVDSATAVADAGR